MTIPLRDLLSPTLALSAGLAFCGSAAAGSEGPDFLDNFVWPGNGAAAADELFVLYADNCGRPHPDRNRPPEVRRTDAGVEVDIFVTPPILELCLAVVQPDTLVAYPIGRLPEGSHAITRRVLVSPERDSPQGRLLRESTVGIDIGDVPNAAVSGSWYDPRNSGSGMFLNLIADPSGAISGDALLYVLTRRSTGEPAWLGGVAAFEDGILTVPLQPPGAAADAPAVATAEFVYTGCGSGRLQIAGDVSLQFPLGDAELAQLTSTAGVPGCVPPTVRPYTLE